MSTPLNPILRRIIRIESKLHNLMEFAGVPLAKIHESIGDITVHHADQHDIMKTLVRIESKLQALMLYEGLNPHKHIKE